MINYSFYQRTLNDWNKLSGDWITVESGNFQKLTCQLSGEERVVHEWKIVGLSINEMLPCVHVVWRL